MELHLLTFVRWMLYWICI